METNALSMLLFVTLHTEFVDNVYLERNFHMYMTRWSLQCILFSTGSLEAQAGYWVPGTQWGSKMFRCWCVI